MATNFSEGLQLNIMEKASGKCKASQSGDSTDAVAAFEARGDGVLDVTADVSQLGS